jgi:CHAT domain-containing protein
MVSRFRILYNKNINNLELSALYEASRCEFDVGHFAQCEGNLLTLLAESKRLDDSSMLLQARLGLVSVYFCSLQLDRAQHELDVLAPLTRHVRDELLALYKPLVGVQTLTQEQASKLLQSFNTWMQAEEYGRLAVSIYKALGRYEDVIQQVDEKLSRVDGQPHNLFLDPQYRHLLQLALQTLDWQQAAKVLDYSTAVTQFGLLSDEIYCYRQLAADDYNPDYWQKAISLARQALNGTRPEEEPLQCITLHANLANSYMGLHQWAEASPELEAAQSLVARLQSPQQRELVSGQLADVEIRLALGQTPPDVPRAQRAMAVSERYQPARLKYLGDPDLPWYHLWLRGRVDEASGQRDQALAEYADAIRLIEDQRLSVQSPHLRETFLRSRAGVYDSYLRLLHAMGNDTAALMTLERMKARVLLEQMASVNLQHTLSPELAKVMQAEREADRARRRQENAMLVAQVDENLAAPGTRSGPTLAPSSTGSKQLLSRENPELAQLMAAAEPPAPAAVAKLLGPDTILVEYNIDADGRSSAFTLRQDGKPHYVALNYGLIDMRTDVSRLRQHMNDEHWQAAAAALYAHLLAPLESDLSGCKHVVMVPCDQLNYVPWAVLGPDPQHLLLDRFALDTLPSAGVLTFCRQKSHDSKHGLVAFALGNAAPSGMAPLPGTRAEVQTLQQIIQPSKTFTEKQFTRERLKQEMGHASYLHVATHGLYDGLEPNRSALITADGPLTVDDLFGQHIKATLVVLSACQTALGRTYSGDEVVGLQRAFMYAGTPSIMSTLWSVDDASTAKFMRYFYESLRQHDKASALQIAQQRLRQEYPQPYFWAPFVLSGDWQ